LMSKKLRRHVPPSDHQRALHPGSALFLPMLTDLIFYGTLISYFV